MSRRAGSKARRISVVAASVSEVMRRDVRAVVSDIGSVCRRSATSVGERSRIDVSAAAVRLVGRMSESLFVGPIACDVAFDERGFKIRWPLLSYERHYVGSNIAWEDVRDLDTTCPPPEVRLRNGKTVFVSAELKSDLAAAAKAAGIREVRRAPVWGHLLDPFLDTEAGEWGVQRDANLASWGLGPREILWIRSRVAVRMHALTFLTWEWQHYGQYDVISVMYPMSFGLPWKRYRYRRFRRWADEIADRPEATESRLYRRLLPTWALGGRARRVSSSA